MTDEKRAFLVTLRMLDHVPIDRRSVVVCADCALSWRQIASVRRPCDKSWRKFAEFAGREGL